LGDDGGKKAEYLTGLVSVQEEDQDRGQNSE
jgi:hypothetical protein